MSEDGRKTICFDLDGTLCTNTWGDYEDAQPFPWAIARVNALAEAGHRIIVLTARGFATGLDWDEVTRGQLERWGVRYERLHFGKPNADVYVDDRAVHTDAWRVSDLTRPPGFALPMATEAGELPVAAPPGRTAIVEVARTYGGRLLHAREHAERSLRRARAAGVRFLASADVVERALADAVAAAPAVPDGEDLIVTIAHAEATHGALVDTWTPEPGAGLHVATRWLREATAGLAPFRGSPGLRASLERRPDAWPLVDDPTEGVADALGAQVGALRGGSLFLTPAAGGPTVEGAVFGELAAKQGLAVDERSLERADVESADELFLLGAPFCLLPLGELDGRPLATATADKLLAEWGRQAGADLAGQVAGA